MKVQVGTLNAVITPKEIVVDGHAYLVKKSKAPRIVVEVEGGCIVNIISTDPKVEMLIVDHDAGE